MKYEDVYKDWGEEAYATMRKLRSGPLSKAKHPQALKLFAEGRSRPYIAKALKVSEAAIQISARFDPEFKPKWAKIKTHRIKQVNDKVIESLLQGNLEIKTTKLPILGSDKKPIYINGTQQFYIAKIEETHRPAQSDLLRFWLAHMDERFGANGGTDNADLSPDDMRKAIANKISVINASATA